MDLELWRIRDCRSEEIAEELGLSGELRFVRKALELTTSAGTEVRTGRNGLLGWLWRELEWIGQGRVGFPLQRLAFAGFD